MLSPGEFSVGTLGSVAPLSLILPRTEYEAVMLVGHIDTAPAAVILSGQHAFHTFMSSGNDSWRGLIIPDVRIEVDETSVFDPNGNAALAGDVVRIDKRLVIRAKSEQSFRSLVSVTVHDGLTSTGDLSAGFKRWQIVVGDRETKRVLWQPSAES